jgi:hypothetical protein
MNQSPLTHSDSEMFGTIYLRDNEWWEKENVYKMGIASFAKDRESTYVTSEPTRGKYVLIIDVPLKQMKIIDNHLKDKFKHLNRNNGGGTEFYDRQIKNEIIHCLDQLNIEYIVRNPDEINRKLRVGLGLYKKVKQILIHYKNDCRKANQINTNERDYQLEVIKYGYEEINEHNAVYINIPTGTGKTYCGYKIISKLNLPIVVIFSPRKIVNQQNISRKYSSMLNHTCIDYSSDKHPDLTKPIVISCCMQSEKDLYEKLKDKEIFVWFDEAHWGIEEWITNPSISREYWFRQKRLFTSASPNKDVVLKHAHIFGSLYSSTVSTFIQSNWLAPIKPFMYCENNKNVNKTTYVLDDFKERDRTWGFCFYNDCSNATQSFENHLEYYKNKETDIKPFLLISKPDCDVNYDLDYAYNDRKTYENTINSIGYVVAQYSMGYDFKQLNFIHFGDPKLSIKDIIQSIGRGLRSDCLSLDGKNLFKELFVSLPIFLDNTGKYENIIEVMRYLLHEGGLSMDNIMFEEKKENILKSKTDADGKEYHNGFENMKSMLCDLLNKKIASIWVSYNDARQINIHNHISSPEQYYKLCKSDQRLPPNPDEYYKGFDWLYYIGTDSSKYYNLEQCKIKVKEYIRLNPHLKNFKLELNKVVSYLNDKDPCIPPNELFIYVYKRNLEDIIQFHSKGKKKIAL